MLQPEEEPMGWFLNKRREIAVVAMGKPVGKKKERQQKQAMRAGHWTVTRKS